MIQKKIAEMSDVKFEYREIPKAEPVELNPFIFRPNTKITPIRYNYVVALGGIGDYIGYLGAIKWIAKNNPQIVGHVYVAPFMIELAKNTFSEFPTWEVHDRQKELTAELIRDYPTLAPNPGTITGLGSHHLDLGMIWYYKTLPVPADCTYPEFFLGEIEIPELPENYAVVTPGGAINRYLGAKAFNGIVDYLKSQGITSVFLGKHLINEKRPPIHFVKEYNLENGINLIEQTSLLQCAKIMHNSRLVVGLDNGLLHLAGCTQAPLIFGYNIASPAHRRPKRPAPYAHVPIYDIFPDPEILSCVFCQSRMKWVGNWDFKNCFYDDFECLKILDDASGWCSLIDKILKG
jgi:hypothetical protein